MNVKDTENKPLAGMTVTLAGPDVSCSTNERGDCEFKDPMPGEHQLRVEGPDRVPFKKTIQLDAPLASTESSRHEEFVVLISIPSVKKEIEEVLERYRAAYEARDAAGIKEVYPRAPQAFVEHLKSIKSITLAFKAKTWARLEVDQTGAGTASVTVMLEQKRIPPSLRNRVTFTLRKSTTGRWEITGTDYF